MNVFVVFWESGEVISEKAMTMLGPEAVKEEYGDVKEEDIVKLFQEDTEKEKEKTGGDESLKSAK